jgi:pimeloyl-ACP methyl ester carboxylesterase
MDSCLEHQSAGCGQGDGRHVVRGLIACSLAVTTFLIPTVDRLYGSEPKAPATEPVPQREPAPPNLTMKTLGGRQFWGDVAFLGGWTIQRNIFTGHHRLLDPRDYRHAWGTLEHCRSKLEELRVDQKLEPMSGEAVILVHGIVRSSKAMNRIQTRLEDDGYLVVPFDYPSTRVDLKQCAGFLDDVIKSLDGVEKISFVAHSMGGLVVRSWLKEHSDERVRTMVMMGTPNHGAELANMLRNNHLFRLILGPSGQQLVSDSTGVIASLPVPEFPFAVIAGGTGTAGGYNPLIPGDDDSIVTVSSAFLPGAVDSLQVPVMHSFLPFNELVVDAVSHFLSDGSFRESGETQPIPVVEVSPD